MGFKKIHNFITFFKIQFKFNLKNNSSLTMYETLFVKSITFFSHNTANIYHKMPV